MNRKQVGVAVALCLSAGLALASSYHGGGWDMTQARPWSEVEAIQSAAERAKSPGYDTRWGKYVLAPDGRFVLEALDDDDGPKAAMIGRYQRTGHWLELRLEANAVNLDSLTAEQRKQYDEYLAEESAEGEEEAEEIAEIAEVDGETTEASEADEEDESRVRRLLVVPYRGGEVLLDEESLVSTAVSWDGSSPLEFYPEAWRVPGLDEKTVQDHEFAIEDPLNANLPWDLAKLLRKDAIDARVSEVLDTAESLKWEQQSTQLRLRLDHGSKHGLYKDMYVYGLPPDEKIYAVIDEVGPDHAIAKVSLERFHPQDPLELPTAGMRMSTRRTGGKGEGCGIDYSAAVRGKVLSVATPADELRYDAEGYAWVEVTIDQGSAQGLSLEDRLSSEDYKLFYGEGRVRGLSSDRATVLWRVQRWDESQTMTLPEPGAALVTPAWQRAAYDVFGSDAAMSK